jgi:hypothetical protein
MPLQYTDGEFEGKKLLIVEGSLDDTVDLAPFEDPSYTYVDCEKLNRMLSVGIRKWVLTLKARPSDAPLYFVRCSVMFVEQLNVIDGFVGNSEVQSFFAPYICEDCDEEHAFLLKKDDVVDSEAPSKTCPSCSKELEFDEDEDEFFEFLED